MNKKNIFFGIFYIIICSLGIWIAFYPTLISNFSLMQTDPGDTRLNNYFLEHSFQLLVNSDYQGSLWSPLFFYPYENVLAFSENIFGSAPVYWMFRAFFSSDIAFQLWMIAMLVLCFLSFVTLMRRLQVGHILSALGGFLFTFNLSRVAHIGHQQLLPQFFTPLAFLSSWDFVKQPTRKRLVLLLLLIYLQVLSGIYLGWFLLFSLILFFSVTYILYSEARIKLFTYLKENRRETIYIAVVWIVLLLITLLPYLNVQFVLGERSYEEVDLMLPRINSWFLAPLGSFWGSLFYLLSQDLPMIYEHIIFAGSTLLVLTCLSLYILIFRKNLLSSERYWLIKICLLVFIAIFCLSLRLPSGFSLWRIVYEVVPGASAIRAVARIWTVAYLYLLVAAILGADALIKVLVFRKLWHILIISILFIIGITEQMIFPLPAYEKEPYISQVTELRDLIKQDCDIAYLSLNPERPFYVDQLSAMWAGLEANVPVVNGYSGNVPPKYGDNLTSMNTSQVVNWLEPQIKDQEKRLCMIFYKSLDKQDRLISTYAVKENTRFSDNFVSYTIQLPIPKLFHRE